MRALLGTWPCGLGFKETMQFWSPPPFHWPPSHCPKIILFLRNRAYFATVPPTGRGHTVPKPPPFWETVTNCLTLQEMWKNYLHIKYLIFCHFANWPCTDQFFFYKFVFYTFVFYAFVFYTFIFYNFIFYMFIFYTLFFYTFIFYMFIFYTVHFLYGSFLIIQNLWLQPSIKK